MALTALLLSERDVREGMPLPGSAGDPIGRVERAIAVQTGGVLADSIRVVVDYAPGAGDKSGLEAQCHTQWTS